jgi:hypothetical protein
VTAAYRKHRERQFKAKGWCYVSGWLPAEQAAQVEAMIVSAQVAEHPPHDKAANERHGDKSALHHERGPAGHPGNAQDDPPEA